MMTREGCSIIENKQNVSEVNLATGENRDNCFCFIPGEEEPKFL
jgi:hypothetical protein